MPMISTISLCTITCQTTDDGSELDPKIENYLKETFRTKDLSEKLVLSIEKLDLSNLGLTSAKGLGKFKNLKKLNLSNNVLTDNSFLKELEHLTDLDLSFNQFKAVKLSSTKIVKLNLRGNRISNIDFVSNLKQLIYFNLRGNDVLDLTPVQALHELQYLNIRRNKVKSLEPLTDLNQLTNLNARNNQINFIAPLINLPLNERLMLSGNDIEQMHLLENKIETIKKTDVTIGIAKPKLSMGSGVFDQPFELELASEEGHDIYYTLDGSLPTTHSNKYDGPIDISKEVMFNQKIYANTKTSPLRDGFAFTAQDVKKAVTVTALAYNGRQFSPPSAASYILDLNLFSNNNLPVISLIMPPTDLFDDYNGIYVPGHTFNNNDHSTGNYYQKGRDYEKKAVVEFFHSDGTLDFQQNIGIRINGSYTRRMPQKSLRLYARSTYGQSRFFTNIFPDLNYDTFKMLILRNSGNDYHSTHIRDGLMHELVKYRNVDVQAYQPAIVLINGEYWGIQNIRERFTDDYINIKYNINRDEIAILKTDYKGEGVHFKVAAGSEHDKNHYNDMIKYVENNDMSHPTNMKHVEKLMDMENFIEYVAFQVYYANTDSFHNNFSVWRSKIDFIEDVPYGHDGRWRWFLYDLDWGMGYGLIHLEDDDPVTFNMIKHVLSDKEEMALFKGLMSNEDFTMRFIKKMLELLNTNFEPTHVKQTIDNLASHIRPEIGNSITRWENIESVEAWEKNIQELHDFAERRPEIVRQHLRDEFKLSKRDLNVIERSIETNKP